MTPARRRVRGWVPVTASLMVCVLTVAGASAASATVPVPAAGPTTTANDQSATLVAPTSGGLPLPILIWAALGVIAAFVGLAMTKSAGRSKNSGRDVAENTALRGLANVGSASAVAVAGGDR
jgi:hypothetical protein